MGKVEEIKIGEYVRTEKGIIYEYTEIEKNDLQARDFRLCNDGKIVKHSPNIIDLIEVGDYVNGREVKHIAMFEGFPDYLKLIFVNEKRLLPSETADNKDIKSIVTKEQFENMEYRLGE